MAWKPEVIADSTGNWLGNALRFATKAEAEANARDLMCNWFSVTQWRVIECEDEVNYSYVSGKLIEVYRHDDMPEAPLNETGGQVLKPPVFLGYGDDDGDD